MVRGSGVSFHQGAFDLFSGRDPAKTRCGRAAGGKTDGLTGLKNHRMFQESLVEAVERARRYNTALSVILLDVDKFKSYNDTFGHPAGDVVLKKVAQVLHEVARTVDLVTRYGGEEFVILLPETDADGATNAAERFRMAIETAFWTERPVTASFGISTFNLLTPDGSTLVSEADKAVASCRLLCSQKQRGESVKD